MAFQYETLIVGRTDVKDKKLGEYCILSPSVLSVNGITNKFMNINKMSTGIWKRAAVSLPKWSRQLGAIRNLVCCVRFFSPSLLLIVYTLME